jgi:hypothetical protein
VAGSGVATASGCEGASLAGDSTAGWGVQAANTAKDTRANINTSILFMLHTPLILMFWVAVQNSVRTGFEYTNYTSYKQYLYLSIFTIM